MDKFEYEVWGNQRVPANSFRRVVQLTAQSAADPRCLQFVVQNLQDTLGFLMCPLLIITVHCPAVRCLPPSTSLPVGSKINGLADSGFTK